MQPLRSSFDAIGKNNIERMPAIVRGTKNDFAKNNPAKTPNAIINK